MIRSLRPAWVTGDVKVKGGKDGGKMEGKKRQTNQRREKINQRQGKGARWKTHSIADGWLRKCQGEGV